MLRKVAFLKTRSKKEGLDIVEAYDLMVKERAKQR